MNEILEVKQLRQNIHEIVQILTSPDFVIETVAVPLIGEINNRLNELTNWSYLLESDGSTAIVNHWVVLTEVIKTSLRGELWDRRTNEKKGLDLKMIKEILEKVPQAIFGSIDGNSVAELS